jgi:hypothetical protein
MSTPPPLWGIGQWVDDTGARVAWAVGNDEINRAIGAAPGVLDTLGVARGDRVLFTSMLSEAAHFWPLIIGCMLSGAQLSCADATAAEAVRVRMFTRLLDYRAVLGVTPQILDGLDALGTPYADVFGAVPVVGARPGAYERLMAAGVAAHHFVLVGPAVAIGVEPDGPAVVDGDEWALDRDPDGIVTVTSRRDRATTFDRTRTAITGHVPTPTRLTPTDPHQPNVRHEGPTIDPS